MRFDITVDDLVVVGVFQGSGHLIRQFENYLRRKGSFPLDIIFQGFAGNIFHDDVMSILGTADIKNADYVWMRQTRRRSGLLAETHNEIFIAGILRT